MPTDSSNFTTPDAPSKRPDDIWDPRGTINKSPSFGTTAERAQWEADRQRGMAAAAVQRGAYKQNFSDYGAAIGQSNSARGSQSDALSMQRSAAMGEAPSRAEILGRSMADQGIQSQMAMGASARGGSMAQAAAMRNAQQAQGANMQQAQNQMAGLRAEEMANARNAYMAGASGMRGQDINAAQLGLQRTDMETRNEQFQRELNQQNQQFFEKQANDIYGRQLDADTQSARLGQEDRHHEDDRFDKWVSAGVSALSGLVGLKTGGKFDGTKPLLVGEEGPEIVLPKGPGVVLNAPQTAAVIGQQQQGVMPLYEPEGQRIGIDASGRGFLASAEPATSSGASLSGPTPRYSVAQAAAARQSLGAAKSRKMTPDELMAEADKMIAGIKRDEAAAIARGPAVRVDRDQPAPEYAQPPQAPDEANTALDRDKALRATMATVAAQQRQLDAMKGAR